MNGMNRPMMNNGTSTGASGSDNFIQLIYGLIWITLVDQLMKLIPEIWTFIKHEIEKKLKKVQN